MLLYLTSCKFIKKTQFIQICNSVTFGKPELVNQIKLINNIRFAMLQPGESFIYFFLTFKNTFHQNLQFGNLGEDRSCKLIIIN